MVWFDESLRFRLCNATISGWLEAWRPPCTKSPFNPAEIPKTETGIDGWLDPNKRR